MWTITWRTLRQHPARFLSTVIAIVLGIGFFVGTSVLTSTVEKSLTSSIADAYADVDVAVRSTDTIDAGPIEVRRQIPVSLAVQIEKVTGVADAAPNLTGYAQIVGNDGKVLDGGQASGTTWIDSDLNPFTLVEGKPPTGAREVVIDRASFDDGDFTVGQQVRVLPAAADQPYTLVGVMAYGQEDTQFGQRVTAFSLPAAQSLFRTTDVDQILVAAQPGIADAELAANLQATLGADLEAVTGQVLTDEINDLVGQFAGVLTIVLQVFAIIALLVGVFIIYNTFTILVAQRSREMALLRAIGATTRQVRTAVLLESILVGLFASILGALAGIGLGWVITQLLSAIGADLGGTLVVPAGTMALGVVLGISITVASAILPARRAASIPPIAALREIASGVVRGSRTRTVIGLSLAAVTVVATIVALTGAGVVWFGVAIVAAIVAAIVLGPVISGPLARTLGRPIAAASGVVGELARDNATRNPRRTATTASALMIGIMLVTTATVFATSLRASLDSQLGEQITGDLVVTVASSAASAGGGFTPDVATAIGELDQVAAVSPTGSANVEIDGDFTQLRSVDAAAAGQLIEIGVTQGSLADLDADSIAVATDQGHRIGDTVTVKFQQDEASLTVTALYDDTDLVGDYLVDQTVLDANTTQRLDELILVRSAGQPDETQQAIDVILADNPVAETKTADRYVEDQAGQVNIVLYLLYGLLGISILVALIGIVNTLALSVMERTREIGLLRAVGMTPRQVRSTIRYEAAIVALIGTTVGLALGMLFGWLGSQAVGDTFPVFAMPWTTLIVIAAAGLLCGIIAGALPARRAARLDVLAAISTE